MRLPLIDGTLFSAGPPAYSCSSSIKAGRMAYPALEQLLLLQLPLVLTFNAFVAPLLELQYGERSHQLAAETSRTLIPGGRPRRVS